MVVAVGVAEGHGAAPVVRLPECRVHVAVVGDGEVPGLPEAVGHDGRAEAVGQREPAVVRITDGGGPGGVAPSAAAPGAHNARHYAQDQSRSRRLQGGTKQRQTGANHTRRAG